MTQDKTQVLAKAMVLDELTPFEIFINLYNFDTFVARKVTEKYKLLKDVKKHL